ncbi:hypothetical protein [Paenibacillus lentus]|uniref:Butirosin biosynthesis protein H N-terminal domain-containing protein n=1 Tax=Paenibacillus lentus TaxID=1338368 RepID=A0A3Q8SE15_9BACL|nr:hypothetical protein [Paenibacillus lentus]AZK48532.1 hypothetical protein EIM92_22065 [Paenibacillus lentus]
MAARELEIVIPPIIGYQYLAYPLCTLFTRQETLPWFYSNFIHLYCYSHLDDDYASSSLPLSFYGEDFVQCPWLITQKLERESILSSPEGIIDFLIRNINLGYTISLNVDEFYIPQRRVYRQIHYAHDVLIYGYDDQSRMFLILGYDQEMQFRRTLVPFHELEQGIEQLPNTERFEEHIFLYKINPSGSYTLDATVIKQALEDYLSGRNISLCHRATSGMLEAAFGTEVYQAIADNLPILVRKRDIRPIHILLEHKKTMSLRLDYLCNQGILPAELTGCFSPVEGRMFFLRHLLMKYAFTNDDTLLRQGLQELTTIREHEQAVLETVVEALERQLIS